MRRAAGTLSELPAVPDRPRRERPAVPAALRAAAAAAGGGGASRRGTFSDHQASPVAPRLDRGRRTQQLAHHHRCTREHRCHPSACIAFLTSRNRRSRSRHALSSRPVTSAATSAFSLPRIASGRTAAAARRRNASGARTGLHDSRRACRCHAQQRPLFQRSPTQRSA